MVKNFNSHPREGGDLLPPLFSAVRYYFNSHPREGGDDRLVSQDVSTYEFQFPPP